MLKLNFANLIIISLIAADRITIDLSVVDVTASFVVAFKDETSTAASGCPMASCSRASLQANIPYMVCIDPSKQLFVFRYLSDEVLIRIEIEYVQFCGKAINCLPYLYLYGFVGSCLYRLFEPQLLVAASNRSQW